ncbi:MAG: hypothetical protein GF401_12320 [Chitinivibrionales bacterium]|nr:hypothetical protein [Chitinivibrionales bacterium]
MMKMLGRLISGIILIGCTITSAQQIPEILMQGEKLDGNAGCFWADSSPYNVTWEVQFYGVPAGDTVKTKYDFGPDGTFEKIITTVATGADTTSVIFDSTFVTQTDIELNLDIEMWVGGEQKFSRRPIGSCTVKVFGEGSSDPTTDPTPTPSDDDDDSGCGTGAGLAFLIPIGIRLGIRRKKK